VYEQYFFQAVEDCRRSFLGPFSPSAGLLQMLKDGLVKYLPENSYQKATEKLYISLTRVSNMQNVMISEYSSKEDLIEVKCSRCFTQDIRGPCCSCFIPGCGGLILPTYRDVVMDQYHSLDYQNAISYLLMISKYILNSTAIQ
ncbi:hypothetical protein JD844_018215, partial [Phrynosoma platyrhinos]